MIANLRKVALCANPDSTLIGCVSGPGLPHQTGALTLQGLPLTFLSSLKPPPAFILIC